MDDRDKDLKNGLLLNSSQDSLVLEPENGQSSKGRSDSPRSVEDFGDRAGEGIGSGMVPTRFRRFYDDVIVPNTGVTLILVAQLFNSMMNAACKLLETDPDFEEPMNPFQILFVRMGATYILCMIYMTVKKVPDAYWGPRELRKLLVLRGHLGFLGVFGLYFSLQYLSVSDATVLLFLSPTVTAIMARVILKERYTLVEAVGGMCSLVGVILIARPSFIFGDPSSSSSGNDAVETSDPWKRTVAIAVALVGACAGGSIVVLLRFIGHKAHALISVSYYSLCVTIISFTAIMVVPSYSFQLPHTARQWAYFTLIGVSGFIMQFSFTAGIQREKAGRAAFMSYTNMIWALLWEITIWHHMPPFISWLGFIIIVGSAISVLYAKNRAKDDEVSREPDIELTDAAKPSRD